MFDREKSGDASRLLLISAAAFVVRAARPCPTLPYAFSHLVLTISSPSSPPLQEGAGTKKNETVKRTERERALGSDRGHASSRRPREIFRGRPREIFRKGKAPCLRTLSFGGKWILTIDASLPPFRQWQQIPVVASSTYTTTLTQIIHP